MARFLDRHAALRPEEIDRFWSKVVVDDVTDCWIWVASKTEGYGQFRTGGGLAHRMAWQTWRGPIPAGLTLDHLCRVRACVNPAHLEPVTLAENKRRGESPAARKARQTHCMRGHEFTPENTIRRKDRRGRGILTGRECRVCRKLMRSR